MHFKLEIMKYKIIVIFFMTLCKINAQENLPLKFIDYEPQWQDLIRIDHYPIDCNCNYELQTYPRQIEDSLYLFYNVRNYEYNGVIIEKRNINDGSKYWSFSRDTTKKRNRIALSHIYMNKNNIDIQLYDEDHYSSEGSLLDWAGAHPAEMLINKENGNIIQEYHTDHSDPNNILLRSIGNWIQNSYDAGLKLIKIEQGYREIRYVKTQKTYYLTDVDSLGHLIKYDTLFLPTVYKNYSHRLFDVDDSTFISVICSTSDASVYDERIQIMYRLMDHELNILKEVDITDQIPDSMKNANCYRADNGNFIIASSWQAEDNSYAQARYFLFDSDGIIKDRIVHTIKAGEDIEYGWLYPIVDVENERLILSHSRQDTRETGTYFELFSSKGDSLNLMRRFEVEGIKDHFRVQYGTMLPSGDLLLYFSQFDWATQMGNPYPINWNVLMMMSKEDLVSSHSVVNDVVPNIILYPNPTDGKFSIKSDNQIKSVLLFTNDGKNIGKQKDINNIDLSDYPSGIYNVMIEQENGAFQIKRIVVQ